MRIIHVLNHTRRQNGNVHAAVDLACEQAKAGHDVTLCSAGGDFDALLRANRVSVVEIPELAASRPPVPAVLALRAMTASRGADIMHAHMMRSAGLGWLATRFSRARLVTTVHNAFERSAILMGLGDRVIAVSTAVGEGMRRRGVPARRLRTVLNGTVGSARRPPPVPAPMSLLRPAVLYVGGLHPRKGVGDLLMGFAQARRTRPDLHLYLVGDGPCASDYRASVAAQDGEYVHFCGSQPDPRPFMLGADVFVLASHADPAPLVIPEAREAGLAMIATRVDGIPELLDDGAAGILVAPHAPSEIAEALLAVLSDAKSLASHRARSQINLGHLALSRVARETIAVYAEVQRRARGKSRRGSAALSARVDPQASP